MKTCRIENLSAGYGKTVVLRDIEMTLKSGEMTALMGANGCGKTTLFHGLMKVDAWAEGSCELEGVDLLGLSPKQRARHVALLPQKVQIPPGYCCHDVLVSGFYPHLPLFGQPDRRMLGEAAALARELGIDGLLEKDFLHISEGQKQMVLLARTLVQDAEMILMDEPDNALDFTHKYGMMEHFHRMTVGKDKIGLVILHDPALVLAYCKHIYLMREGTILTEIFPEEEKRGDIEAKLRLLYPALRLYETDGGPVPVYAP